MFKNNYVYEIKQYQWIRLKTNFNYMCLRPSVRHMIATDWSIDRYLKWCLMYSRNLYNIFLLFQGYLKINRSIYENHRFRIVQGFIFIWSTIINQRLGNSNYKSFICYTSIWSRYCRIKFIHKQNNRNNNDSWL